jgi:small-conductance mechanosensitive channel
VIRASALLLRDPLPARAVAAIAWIIAALDILGLLTATSVALDNLALTIGTLPISVLLVIKAVLVVAILLWIAVGLARMIDTRLQNSTALNASGSRIRQTA